MVVLPHANRRRTLAADLGQHAQARGQRLALDQGARV